MVPVQRGDSLSMSAFASYQAGAPVGKSWALAAFVSSLFNQGAEPPPGTEGYRHGKYTPYIGLALAASITAYQTEEGVPNAYLKYIVLDQDSAYVYSDVQVVSSAAGQNWQELKLNYKVKQEGFVQVFVYNESGQEVFFDDLTIRKDPALIVQENHYDPWGMNLVGIEKQGRPDHKFQYNGIEKQEEIGLNADMAFYRTLDPQLGRWWQVDPEAQSFESLTPYNSNFNNPIKYDDPLGDCPCALLPLIPIIAEGLVLVTEAAIVTTVVLAGYDALKDVDWSKAGPQYSSPAVSAAQSLSNPGESIKAPDQVAAPKVKVTDENGRVNARGKNKTVPDTGTPNTVARNKPGTTYKKYGPDGVVQKEFYKGHNGMGTPKKEKLDHVHDHKPKPNRHPNDPQPTDKQRGRTPKKNELKKDFGI